jgi:hypothetical protein
LTASEQTPETENKADKTLSTHQLDAYHTHTFKKNVPKEMP